MSDQVIALPLSTWSRVLVASPAYLASAGGPGSPEALGAHAILGSGRDARGIAWTLVSKERTAEVRVKTRFVTNSGTTLRDLAVASHGIALLPPWFVARDVQRKRLVRVLPAWEATPTVIYLLYRAAVRKQRPIKLVIDFLRTAYPALERT